MVPNHTDDILLQDILKLRAYAILRLDGDGRVLGCNAGVEAIFGYAPDELKGRHFSCFFSESDVERGVDQQALLQALAGDFEQVGLAMVRKDDSRFRASLMLENMSSDGVVSVVMVIRDVTGYFNTQKRVREAQELTLRGQRLDAVGKLTLGLSHDFNNLLSVIGNSLDMLAARRTGDEAARRILDIALRAVERGTQLTRQMLAFGGGHAVVPQLSHVNDLLRASHELYERVCGEGVALEIRATDDLPPITVDVAQLEAALLNLLSNSRDAMNGVGHVVLEARPEMMAAPTASGGERPFVCITVGDSGPGINGDIRGNVFEPFFTTKAVGDGSGLGLSQVYGFAVQSGGLATIGTSPLGGAAVSIYLPAVL
ncbi:ATP-binding protein [Stenotrophomonas sp. Iso1]|uniref:two-component system sensor histidine kinase NtrB n=1 Tax=Stenotrophomonas sp. Iso1 TaxID=2977283 RepID=UPI0022B76EEF|nr:ATP-binding protein [Stenotrophomonas sp. Iso1]